jgi:hypothetical protein
VCFGAVCRGVVSDALYDVVCCDAQGPPDADVQREVAAAMESVFPRVGLKAFMAISPPEKAGQVRASVGVHVFQCCAMVIHGARRQASNQTDKTKQVKQTNRQTDRSDSETD